MPQEAHACFSMVDPKAALSHAGARKSSGKGFPPGISTKAVTYSLYKLLRKCLRGRGRVILK